MCPGVASMVAAAVWGQAVWQAVEEASCDFGKTPALLWNLVVVVKFSSARWQTGLFRALQEAPKMDESSKKG